MKPCMRMTIGTDRRRLRRSNSSRSCAPIASSPFLPLLPAAARRSGLRTLLTASPPLKGLGM